MVLKVNITRLGYKINDELPERDGHKLRGFFANEFENVLFHNHKEDGSLRYSYPLVQYKIINKEPMILGINEGAEIIKNNFLYIREIEIGDKVYHEPESNLKLKTKNLFVNNSHDISTYRYDFITPWLGLNQKNYKKYRSKYSKVSSKEKTRFLERLIIGNILSFAKGIDWWLKEKIILEANLEEKEVNFKNKKMIGFKGGFSSNIYLPEYIGLGKSTSRGFGTIKRKKMVK